MRGSIRPIAAPALMLLAACAAPQARYAAVAPAPLAGCAPGDVRAAGRDDGFFGRSAAAGLERVAAACREEGAAAESAYLEGHAAGRAAASEVAPAAPERAPRDWPAGVRPTVAIGIGVGPHGISSDSGVSVGVVF